MKKIMKVNLYILFFALIFSSCTKFAKKNVEVDQTISINTEVDKNIQIDKNIEVEQTEIKTSENELAVSLTVFSTLYNSFAIGDLFESLKKEEIRLAEIQTHGFSALLTAIYALEESQSFLEWKTFKLIKELKGVAAYSHQWKEILNQIIDKEFKNKNIEDLKLRLKIMTILDGKVFYIENGSLAKALKSTLNLSSKESYFSQPVWPIKSGLNNSSHYSQYIQLRSKKMSIQNMTAFEYGIYTRYLGYLIKNDELIYRIGNEEQGILDKIRPLSDIKSEFQKSIDEYIAKLKIELKEWKESIPSS